jgi:glycerol-1-phosphatase
MGSLGEPSFSAPTEIISANGFLFDFDGKTCFQRLDSGSQWLTRSIGTIIDSTDAIVKHWHTIGDEIGVDPKVILESSHGRRSIDVLRLYDPSKANWECKSGRRTQQARD